MVTNMIELDIKINREEFRKQYLEKLDEYIRKIDMELTFWDTSELKKIRFKKSSSLIQDSPNGRLVGSGIFTHRRLEIF